LSFLGSSSTTSTAWVPLPASELFMNMNLLTNHFVLFLFF
jgi:hypothetical protein